MALFIYLLFIFFFLGIYFFIEFAKWRCSLSDDSGDDELNIDN